MSMFRTRDGVNLAFEYEDEGYPTVVLIHGAYLSLSEWRPQRAALNGISSLFVDLRGHGRSDRGGYPYSVATFGDDLLQLFDHLNLNSVVLCGHSLGGMVAQQLALYAPERVAKLVLADTSYGVRSTWHEALLTDLALPMFNLVPIAWQARLFADQIGKYSADARRYVQAEISRHEQDPKNYRDVWRAVAQFDGYDALSQIRCRALVMVGARNKQTHAQARAMKERIAQCELVYIEKAGHMLNWDNAPQFNRALLEFLV